ncbi:MAG: transcription factor IIB [Nitrosopumilus sp.]|nr:transcription factor IIB [Nitrosopumilus sp.]
MAITVSCDNCGSTLLENFRENEIVCNNCGLIFSYEKLDIQLSKKLEEKMKMVRATGKTTYSKQDLGITSEISISSKDFSGKTINREVANQMHNLRKWQQKIRVSSPKERRLANILTKIGESCVKLNLSKNVLETASMIYRNLDGVINLKGKSVVSISAAVIYMACKQCDVIRSLEEITRSMTQKEDVKIKTKLAAKYYRSIIMEIGHFHPPEATIDKNISKIASLIQIDVKVERLALEIAEKIKDSSITDGKYPNGVAAAYLYIASILLGENVLQRDVSSIAGVTEQTIRERAREILKNKFTIKLKPSLFGDYFGDEKLKKNVQRKGERLPVGIIKEENGKERLYYDPKIMKPKTVYKFRWEGRRFALIKPTNDSKSIKVYKFEEEK